MPAIDSNGIVNGLITGGLLTLLGVLFTMRSGRQKQYDERFDKRLSDLEGDNTDLTTENQKLREERIDLLTEVARLKQLLRNERIDPDTGARLT